MQAKIHLLKQFLSSKNHSIQIHSFNTQKSHKIALKQQIIPFQLKHSNQPCIQVLIDIPNNVQTAACIIHKWIKIQLLKTSIFIHFQYYIPFLWSTTKIQANHHSNFIYKLPRESILSMEPLVHLLKFDPSLDPPLGLNHQSLYFSFSFHTIAQSYLKKLTITSYYPTILSPRSVTCDASFNIEVYGFDIQ